jgi:hypothetical protein
MPRRGRALCSVLALLSMLTAFAATCAAGPADSEQMQMACCKEGHHKCGTPEKPSDCCKTQVSHDQQVTTIAKADLQKQPLTWTPVTWALSVLPADTSFRTLVRVADPDTSPPGGLERPIYIKFSVLLI